MKTFIGNRTAVTSILIVYAVILLFLFWLIYFREPVVDGGSLDLTILPVLNALLNSMSATCLVFGFLAIRRGNRVLHKNMMLSALSFSFLFLVSYLTYHAFHGNTLFQSQGWIRPLYFFILISHISLSVVVLPLILTTVFFAATGNFILHPKIARITLPIWMYVSVTGVLVYLMLYRL